MNCINTRKVGTKVVHFRNRCGVVESLLNTHKPCLRRKCPHRLHVRTAQQVFELGEERGGAKEERVDKIGGGGRRAWEFLSNFLEVTENAFIMIKLLIFPHLSGLKIHRRYIHTYIHTYFIWYSRLD